MKLPGRSRSQDNDGGKKGAEDVRINLNNNSVSTQIIFIGHSVQKAAGVTPQL
jgi:hypothetical protein